jgi:coenzyme F420-0:L-glutamate ligase/coenzyme F420-1:gamma-L-glutamate ligase
VTVTIHPIGGIPEIRPGDSLAAVICEAIAAAELGPHAGDVLVVTHKVVSKAEGALVDLGEDPETGYRRAVADETAVVLRRRGDLVIARTRHGFVCANAGVDRSNVDDGTAVLLPRDPDRSAHRLRLGVARATGIDLAVVVTDTFGRAWRRGLVDVAVGISGIDAMLDLRGTTDAVGRELTVTEIALVDEIAAAADLVMGKASGVPAALVRGLAVVPGDGRATDLVRPPEEDLFL